MTDSRDMQRIRDIPWFHKLKYGETPRLDQLMHHASWKARPYQHSSKAIIIHWFLLSRILWKFWHIKLWFRYKKWREYKPSTLYYRLITVPRQNKSQEEVVRKLHQRIGESWKLTPGLREEIREQIQEYDRTHCQLQSRI